MNSINKEWIKKILLEEIRNQLCKLFKKDFLEELSLSLNCLKCFDIDNLVKIRRRNNLKPLKVYKNRFGIYFFVYFDKGKIKHKYIGSASKGDLYDRIQKQLNTNPDNANFALNICEKHGVGNCKDKKELKKLIKKEANALCIWPIPVQCQDKDKYLIQIRWVRK